MLDTANSVSPHETHLKLATLATSFTTYVPTTEKASDRFPWDHDDQRVGGERDRGHESAGGRAACDRSGSSVEPEREYTTRFMLPSAYVSFARF